MRRRCFRDRARAQRPARQLAALPGTCEAGPLAQALLELDVCTTHWGLLAEHWSRQDSPAEGVEAGAAVQRVLRAWVPALAPRRAPSLQWARRLNHSAPAHEEPHA